ncbi:hypothetical protein WOLCODRAFT_156896 [Wolfiporia cocos MD-104 SS10]|uniref:Uncharacterized protein n=1 Tax=Wolfiporia cocos (strain MD-104) TaxID=742152 RepID=A0A2H3J2G5_WOLCO|nr:hypothetical protein WOLCODRAFT_156896 [Wolfiporia cocos MD-104 SS10]
MEDVWLYARYIKTIPRSRRIARVSRILSSAAVQGKQCSVVYFGTFAAMFAGGQLPRLSSLWIEGERTPGELSPGEAPLS